MTPGHFAMMQHSVGNIGMAAPADRVNIRLRVKTHSSSNHNINLK